MFKKMFISILGLSVITISVPFISTVNDSLAIKTADNSQEELKINNIYFLGDNIFESGVYTNSLTIVLKEIAKYRPIIPSIPKAKKLTLYQVIITIIHLVMDQ